MQLKSMKKIKKIIHVLLYERGKIGLLLLPKLGKPLSDKTYVKWYYRYSMGKKLNLKNPQTFTEKLQWLKVYDHNPLYTTLVDKYAVKPWVAERIGEQYIIPTLGVWDSFNEIEFEKLPNQFVLKTTHGGGSIGVVICKDKASFNKVEAKKRLEHSMKISGYEKHREWPYKNVPRRIIAEVYLEPQAELNDLPDYKFFCFNGEPKFCQVISGRNIKKCIDFFDKDWNHQPFREPSRYTNADVLPLKPKCFEEMWNLAAKLAEGKAFTRIDFYEVNGQVLFGEVTFFPTSGLGVFEPKEYDAILGKMIHLPID